MPKKQTVHGGICCGHLPILVSHFADGLLLHDGNRDDNTCRASIQCQKSAIVCTKVKGHLFAVKHHLFLLFCRSLSLLSRVCVVSRSLGLTATFTPFGLFRSGSSASGDLEILQGKFCGMHFRSCCITEHARNVARGQVRVAALVLCSLWERNLAQI